MILLKRIAQILTLLFIVASGFGFVFSIMVIDVDKKGGIGGAIEFGAMLLGFVLLYLALEKYVGIHDQTLEQRQASHRKMSVVLRFAFGLILLLGALLFLFFLAAFGSS